MCHARRVHKGRLRDLIIQSNYCIHGHALVVTRPPPRICCAFQLLPIRLSAAWLLVWPGFHHLIEHNPRRRLCGIYIYKKRMQPWWKKDEATSSSNLCLSPRSTCVPVCVLVILVTDFTSSSETPGFSQADSVTYPRRPLFLSRMHGGRRGGRNSHSRRHTQLAAQLLHAQGPTADMSESPARKHLIKTAEPAQH